MKDSAAAFEKQLHDPQAAPPPETVLYGLVQYQAFVPEVDEVLRESEVHKSINSAKDMHASGRSAAAIKSLEAMRADPEIATAIREIEAAGAANSAQVIESALAVNSWSGFANGLEQFGKPEMQLLPDADRAALQGRFADAVKRRVQTLVPAGTDLHSAKAIS